MSGGSHCSLSSTVVRGVCGIILSPFFMWLAPEGSSMLSVTVCNLFIYHTHLWEFASYASRRCPFYFLLLPKSQHKYRYPPLLPHTIPL
jgi:hypothetical protein